MRSVSLQGVHWVPTVQLWPPRWQPDLSTPVQGWNHHRGSTGWVQTGLHLHLRTRTHATKTRLASSVTSDRDPPGTLQASTVHTTSVTFYLVLQGDSMRCTFRNAFKASLLCALLFLHKLYSRYNNNGLWCANQLSFAKGHKIHGTWLPVLSCQPVGSWFPLNLRRHRIMFRMSCSCFWQANPIAWMHYY